MKSLQTKIIIILTIILTCILSTSGAYIYGRFFSQTNKTEQPTEITSQTILDKINNQYFIVTKTLFLDSKTTIVADEGSDWSNLLWGNEITAQGIVRVDLGVDAQKIEPEDVIIDQKNQKITIYLPEAEILDGSLFGDLDIEAKKGVISTVKSLFDDSEKEDFNHAVRELIKIAETRVKEDPAIYDEAKDDATRLISLILSETGYSVDFQ